MGSFNVVCQVSRYPIGRKDRMVGFFLKAQSPKEDESHRPDRPLHTMFGQWTPAHLPVRGVYEDYGFMLPDKNSSSTAINHAADKLHGFDFELESWEQSDITDRHSIYHFWQIREDVYHSLVSIGQRYPDALLPENKSILYEAFQGIETSSSDFQDALSFYAGLNALGYAFREVPYMPDQSAYNDLLRLLPIRKAFLLSHKTDKGPVAELPGVGPVACGLSNRPILANEEIFILPLSAKNAEDYDNTGRYTRASNFEVNSYYSLIEGSFSARISEAGTIVTHAGDEHHEDLLRLLGGYTQVTEKKRFMSNTMHLSAMVISKAAMDICRPLVMAYKDSFWSKTHSVADMLRKDFSDAKQLLDKAREAFTSNNPDAIRGLLETQDLDWLMDEKYMGETEESKASSLKRLPFHFCESLKNLQADSDYGTRTSLFSSSINTSSSLLHVDSIIKTNRQLMDYLKGDLESDELDQVLAGLVENAGINLTLGHIGIGLHPTEPRKLGVPADISLAAWEEVEHKTYKAVDREFKALKHELDM